MAAAQAAKNQSCVRLDKILTMRDIYINYNLTPPKEFTSSRTSTEFKDILQWNMSQNDRKHCPNQQNCHRVCDARGIAFYVCWEVNGNWDNNMIKISKRRESHCRTNTSLKINKSKRARIWQSKSRIREGKLTIWVRLFEIEKLKQSSPGLSVLPEC